LYGSFYGRVYQDINLNGRFDPGLDIPQANVKVRVDGNRYVVSDESGRYRVEEVKVGEHNVYLDLLSVRADLTLLDGQQQAASLLQGRDSIVDFRLVRTGRITGVVWLDQNGNGQFDEGEQPLPDVRLVAGTGRDTLTDENGVFRIGDLPPGEHVIVVDEKTLPATTVSATGSLSVKVLAGSETGNTGFPITLAPAEIKLFTSK
jgi:SdrD B-like domain